MPDNQIIAHGILHFPDSNNESGFQEVYPINTINENLYNEDGTPTKTIIDEVIDYREVNTLQEMYALTNLHVGTIINVNGTVYRVTNTSNTSNADGYEVVNNPLKPAIQPVDVVTYTSADIVTP